MKDLIYVLTYDVKHYGSDFLGVFDTKDKAMNAVKEVVEEYRKSHEGSTYVDLNRIKIHENGAILDSGLEVNIKVYNINELSY